MNINKVVIMGRLTHDPELRKTEAGKSIVHFSVAVNRDYRKDGDKKTDFIDCVAFAGTADFVAKYFRKGSSIIIEDGAIQTDMYEKDGQKRKSVNVWAKGVKFGEAKKQESGAAPFYSVGATSDFEEMTEEASDELPF
jgi:single-strand DNA-binding protein